MMEDKKPIYLDQKGYEQYLKEIESLKKRLHDNDISRNDAFNAGAADGWSSSEMGEVERVDTIISNNLRIMYEDLKRIVIVEKQKDDNIIDIGDVVIIEMDGVEETIKLVGSTGDPFSYPHEVSINSPLGSAIYQKRIGESCSYSVNKHVFSLIIKQKLDLSEEETNRRSL